MTSSRLRLGLIFGGRSIEHEVSVVSAEHVIAAADPERFEVVPVGVTRTGAWLSVEETRQQLAKPDPPFKKQLLGGDPATMLPTAARALGEVDVVFPLIHGQHGEDGTLQGMLELAGIPYCGCGVAASAAGMDKALMKAVFAQAGIEVGPHRVVYPEGRDLVKLARDLEDELGLPLFVKPANGGSSVGIQKVHDREALAGALGDAGKIDPKLVIESHIDAREVEVGILGDRDDPKATGAGEIHFEREFYDFEAKYLDPRSQIIIPANVDEDTVARLRELAIRAFRAIDGSGLSRVDFFLRPDGSLMIDEINTMPGFTPFSMYPRLWQAEGVSYSELITRLVELAIDRHRERPIV
jgi:D-alanine-D-alanine ligase